MKQLKVVLIGAGSRGKLYTNIMAAQPEKYQIVAVADPIDSRRNFIKETHGLGEEMCFCGWKELFAKGKIADVAVIATMDKQHFEPTRAAIELGYDILLEKPISPVPLECKILAEQAQKKDVKIVVCHVLRYTPLYKTLKKILDDGIIGDIISVNHEECVWDQHYCHSFVRGNWGNSARSSSMLLQKSCHDIDIIQWLLGKRCRKVQSFGSLTHFRKENAPQGAPEYCIDGCPKGEECPYNAVKIYLGDDEKCWFRNKCTKDLSPTYEMKERAMHTTQYGKCAYQCDNDVVDHQTVNMLFEDDVTVTFTMNGFTKGDRVTHIMGTKGEIHAHLDGYEPIEVYNLKTRETTQVPVAEREDTIGAHGGGDDGIVEALYQYIAEGIADVSVSEIRVSSENHMTVFAAEESRESGGTVDVADYIESLG